MRWVHIGIKKSRWNFFKSRTLPRIVISVILPFLHGKLSLWGILLRCVCNENNVFHMELSGWFALRECVLFLFCPVNIQRFVFIKIEFIHYKQLITNNNILTYFQNPPWGLSVGRGPTSSPCGSLGTRVDCTHTENSPMVTNNNIALCVPMLERSMRLQPSGRGAPHLSHPASLKKVEFVGNGVTPIPTNTRPFLRQEVYSNVGEDAKVPPPPTNRERVH